MNRIIDIVFGAENAGHLKMMSGFFEPKYGLNTKTMIHIDADYSIGLITKDFTNTARLVTDAALLYSHEEDILTTSENEAINMIYEYAEDK